MEGPRENSQKSDRLDELDKDIKFLNRQLEILEKEIEELQREKKPDSLHLDDIFQELAGAVVVALTMALSDEIWELATKLSFLHIVFIYLFVLAVANVFIYYGNQKQWARQTVFGFIQLRLLTSSVLSLIVSAVVVLLLGIYPYFIDSFVDYLKVVLFVAAFSTIGGLGLDMAR